MFMRIMKRNAYSLEENINISPKNQQLRSFLKQIEHLCIYFKNFKKHVKLINFLYLKSKFFLNSKFFF